jgi:hypothetical protein
LAHRYEAGAVKSLERDPDAATIVAAALMIIAPVVFSVAVPVTVKIPVVRMIIESHAGGPNAGFRVPAIAIATTHYICGCCDGRRSEGADCEGADDSYAGNEVFQKHVLLL